MEPHISLAAEKIAEINGFPLTNSLLVTWMVMAFILIVAFFTTRRLSMVPRGLQNVVEFIIEILHGLFYNISKEKTAQFFPLLATLFLFIILGNWAGLLPGVGSIGLVAVENGHEEFVPLFRGATADLNTTLALAVISVIALQYYGFKTLGRVYVTRFINLRHPISFFLGILEIISEFAKVVSFSFRLFGNIFAGEVLLTVVAFLMPILAPLPFLGLEIFVGFIQAFIFAMLTAVFLRVATLQPAH